MLNDRDISARLAVCLDCPNFRQGPYVGLCLLSRDGTDALSPERFEERLMEPHQPTDCPPQRRWDQETHRG
jgi:hypothetical protein